MLGCPDRSQYCGDGYKQVPWSEFDGRFVFQSVKLVSDGSFILHIPPLPLHTPFYREGVD